MNQKWYEMNEKLIIKMNYINIFWCNKCKMNICPICKKNNKEHKHNIIDYNEKNYICEMYNNIHLK